MNSFELEHRISANRFLLVMLALHVPAFTIFAAFGLGSVLVALVGSLVLCAVPAILFFASPSSLGTSISISSATMGMSMLLIFLGDGKIEYHFHVFSFLAVLCYLANIWSLIAAAGTIAVHHVVGWWLVPRALFNYDAAFSDVVVHALFVVVETVICCMVAHQLAATIRMRGILEAEVGRTAEQVAMGSAEIASFVENFARSAATQANMVDMIANTSQQMRQQVTSNLQSATSTQGRIAQTVSQIEGAHERLAKVNTEMQAVSVTSRKISSIVNLMMDIARQTNILAVNASIEASRSGNAGGGFGVIADQVRDLAVRTTEASTEIDSLISNSVGKVESSARDIEGISHGFAELTAATQQMKLLLDQVNEMGRSQAGGIEQISESMRQISAETQNFAAAAKETAGTSSQLSELAAELRNTLTTLH
jgi:methyl-accepting chemotaxis protein